MGAGREIPAAGQRHPAERGRLRPDPTERVGHHRINGTAVTSQTGEVKVKGLELEAVGNVTDNLKVVASYTQAKSEVQDGEFKGKRLQLAHRRPRRFRPRRWRSLHREYLR